MKVVTIKIILNMKVKEIREKYLRELLEEYKQKGEWKNFKKKKL